MNQIILIKAMKNPSGYKMMDPVRKKASNSMENIVGEWPENQKPPKERKIY